MDIAKIRKKFKDASGQGTPKPGGEAAQGLRKTDVSEPLPEQHIKKAEAEAHDEKIEALFAEGETADSEIDLLTFNLAREEYAFKIDEIREIIKPQRITRIPKSEPYLLGITSLRGKIIPVIDLRMMLSLDDRSGGIKTKQKILILNGPKGPIGALIDRVIGVIRPSVSSIVETPPHLPEAEMRFIEGVAIVDGRFISIVRIEEAVAL